MDTGLIVGAASLGALGLLVGGGALWLVLLNRQQEAEPEPELDWKPVLGRARDNAWDAPLEHAVLQRVIAAANPTDSPLEAAVAEDRIQELGGLVEHYDGMSDTLIPAIDLAHDILSKLRDAAEPWVTLAECALWCARDAGDYDHAMLTRSEFLARRANELRPGNAETEAIAAEYRLRLGHAQEAWNRSAGIDTWRGQMVAGEAAAALGRLGDCRLRFEAAREAATTSRGLLLSLRLAELLHANGQTEEGVALVLEVLAARADHPWALRLKTAWVEPEPQS